MNHWRTWVVVVLLGGGFGWASYQALAPRVTAAREDKIVIRFGHWLLHAGMREGIDEVIAAYEALHPHVEVQQVAVPIRTWHSWQRTQYVGGTAPDLMGILGVNEDTFARYFLPLNAHLAQTNPYNVGTQLEGVPWRDTFRDSLRSVEAITPSLGDTFGVVLQVNSERLFYNRDLLRRITGRDEPPATFEELREVVAQIAEYNQREGRNLIPISCCEPHADKVYRMIASPVTQRATLELNPWGAPGLEPWRVAALVVEGGITVDSPEVRASFAAFKEVGDMMPPGFLQLARDDSLFMFLQQQAVMIYTGSWDFGILTEGADFPVGVAPMPVPTAETEPYNAFALGPVSEAALAGEATVGVTRASRHPEIALDFLRFISSPEQAAKFSARSQRPSAIVGVDLPPELAGLQRHEEGWFPGYNLLLAELGAGHTRGALLRNLSRLLGQRGSPATFLAGFGEELPRAARMDLERYVRDRRVAVRRVDAQVGFLQTDPDGLDAARWAEAMENQQRQEMDKLIAGRTLAR